jgi:secondary thiamine-phosphate synthase enzyme
MSLRQTLTTFRIRTQGKGLYEFTALVDGWLREQEVGAGLLTLHVQHTSASLTIQENADPDVILDLNDWFGRLVRENDPHFRHTLEGPDDMPAHIRAALTATQLSIPVMGGSMALGIWQGIYLFEHRRAAHTRTVAAHLLGE